MSAADDPTGRSAGPLVPDPRRSVASVVGRAFSAGVPTTRLAFLAILGLSAAAAAALAMLAILLAEAVYAWLPRDVALAGLFNVLILGVCVALVFCLVWIYLAQCLNRGRAMGLGPAAAVFQAAGLPVVGATVLTFADGPLVMEAGLALVFLPAALFVVLPDRPARAGLEAASAP